MRVREGAAAATTIRRALSAEMREAVEGEAGEGATVIAKRASLQDSPWSKNATAASLKKVADQARAVKVSKQQRVVELQATRDRGDSGQEHSEKMAGASDSADVRREQGSLGLRRSARNKTPQ